MFAYKALNVWFACCLKNIIKFRHAEPFKLNVVDKESNYI